MYVDTLWVLSPAECETNWKGTVWHSYGLGVCVSVCVYVLGAVPIKNNLVREIAVFGNLTAPECNNAAKSKKASVNCWELP